LLDKAHEWANRITANAPLAVQATKESVLRGLALDMEEAYKVEQAIKQHDLPERRRQGRAKAFAEKRPPVWQGK